MLKYVLFYCVAVVTVASGTYVNEMDQPFDFECPPGSIISYISSVHDNRYEGRRWELLCRAAGNTHPCEDSYVNTFDNPVSFKCPGDKVLAGVKSYHDDSYDDRRFIFQCCAMIGQSQHGCYTTTGDVNAWDGKLTLSVPIRRVLKGAYSHHDNAYEDRVWKFEICSTRFNNLQH
ncbi:unnamed protein product [Lymnaea stagnalis]|uniref:Dermatopontin n=1 Tax=Lymnaea stagnalis TaxID=6523 RepID=A0AAV2H9N4_LYMST